MFRSWQAMATCVLDESRSMSYRVVFSTTWWLLENDKPSAVWTTTDMTPWIKRRRKHCILSWAHPLHQGLNKTNTRSSNRATQIFLSISSVSSDWPVQLSGSRCSCRLHSSPFEHLDSHLEHRLTLMMKETPALCSDGEIQQINQKLQRGDPVNPRVYQWTWQQWWRRSGHSESAPDCSSSPGWRCGLVDLCWPTPTASHLKQHSHHLHPSLLHWQTCSAVTKFILH